MQGSDKFTLVKDTLCMITALGGSIFEASRDAPPRWELLAFYALILGFGTAVPAARGLFASTTQQPDAPPEPEPTPSASTRPVSLERPPRRAMRRRGDAGTTR